jgi:quinol-cytochrome oxidoreductase complex cytochrome b subunit
MGSSIAVLFLLPWLFKAETRSLAFRPMSKFLFWIFLICALLLGWIGSMSASQPFVFIGQSLTTFYFSYFLVLGPALIFLERLFWGDAPMGEVERL